MGDEDEPRLSEIDRERMERAQDLADEDGPGWADLYAPGTLGCHELYDRTMLAFNLVEEMILSHPACVRDPEWFALAYRAFKALEDLYERIGDEHVSNEGEDEHTGLADEGE